jgi:hypothetical protein
MKKFVITLLAGLMLATPAMARGGGHPGAPIPTPAPVHHRWHYADDFAAGVFGTAAGIVVAETLLGTRTVAAPQPQVQVQPVVSTVKIYEPERKCYTVVSRKTGEVRQECVDSASDSVIYVD